MRYLFALVSILLCAVAAMSILPVIDTDLWWIRVLDYMRLQYVVALVILLVAMVPLIRGRLRAGLVAGAIGLAALVWNGIVLAPYVGGDADRTACTGSDEFTIMSANVLLGNDDYEGLIRQLEAVDPDVLLVMETDEGWDRALAELDMKMPHTVQRITGSYFGMHFKSKFPISASNIVLPAGQDAPAISTDISLPNGDVVQFLGIHPRPPHPGLSSTGRDGQLAWAALKAREIPKPVILVGDLNSVPWEGVVQRMRRIARLIDPREVRGFKATFDAQSWWRYWPLDHVLTSETVDVTRMDVGESFGSDHYPITSTICMRNGPRSAPQLQDGDIEAAQLDIAKAERGPDEKVGD